jgi:hypothetical protein
VAFSFALRAGHVKIFGCFTQYGCIRRIVGKLGKAPFEVF